MDSKGEEFKNFLNLTRCRLSCRDYSERSVPDDLIDNCLEAARLAPSACNKQPWRFVIVKNSTQRHDICENALLPGISMPWLKKAPVIVALCAELSVVTHKLAPAISGVDYHAIDLGIAGEHFVLAAAAQGLGTCWIGWFKKKKVRKILNLKRSLDILSLISLGYPESKMEPRQRLELNEIKMDLGD